MTKLQIGNRVTYKGKTKKDDKRVGESVIFLYKQEIMLYALRAGMGIIEQYAKRRI